MSPPSNRLPGGAQLPRGDLTAPSDCRSPAFAGSGKGGQSCLRSGWPFLCITPLRMLGLWEVSHLGLVFKETLSGEA